MQETYLFIQNTVLRAVLLYFYKGLRKCFANDYLHVYFTVLLTVDLMRCPVIHLPTFQPPVDGARWRILSNFGHSFYRSAVSLRTKL